MEPEFDSRLGCCCDGTGIRLAAAAMEPRIGYCEEWNRELATAKEPEFDWLLRRWNRKLATAMEGLSEEGSRRIYPRRDGEGSAGWRRWLSEKDADDYLLGMTEEEDAEGSGQRGRRRFGQR
jgi:hypothetical protein